MVTTHSTVSTCAPNERCITGSTILTTLPSSADMKLPLPTAISTHHFLSRRPPPALREVFGLGARGGKEVRALTNVIASRAGIGRAQSGRIDVLDGMRWQ